MYKIMLSCFVIVSCFAYFAKGQDVTTQASTTQTDCDKLQNCSACVESTLNCTFCAFSSIKNGSCITNATICKDQGGTPMQTKAQCDAATVTTSTIPTADTTPSVTAPVTPKTESPITEASSSDASEGTTTPSKPSPAPSGRHFDPPSFIGGTVLSLGLLAIVYVGFKFYKARTERNYHTL